MNAEIIDARLQALEQSQVTRVARAALRSEDVQALTWQWESLRTSLGIATGGLYRVRGTARGRDGAVHEWAAILKVIRPPNGTRHDAVARDPRHWAYWKREPLAYGSGLLAHLPGGLVAPRCLWVEERDRAETHEGGEVWLWLEELLDDYGGWWPPERTLLAARHVGAFNGAFLAHLPDLPWLGHGYLRQRIERTSSSLALFEDDATWRHPLLREHFEPGVGKQLRAVWARRYALLHEVEGLPQTVCHGDCHRGNLFAVRREEHADQECTAAIDWGTMGIGPVGADLAELVLSRAIAGELLAAGGVAFGERLFEHYADALRETGQREVVPAARRGFAATVALAGTSRLHWTLERGLEDERRGAMEHTLWTDAEEVVRRWAALTRMTLALTDE